MFFRIFSNLFLRNQFISFSPHFITVLTFDLKSSVITRQGKAADISLNELFHWFSREYYIKNHSLYGPLEYESISIYIKLFPIDYNAPLFACTIHVVMKSNGAKSGHSKYLCVFFFVAHSSRRETGDSHWSMVFFFRFRKIVKFLNSINSYLISTKRQDLQKDQPKSMKNGYYSERVCLCEFNTNKIFHSKKDLKIQMGHSLEL